ncbi:hypothetical protein SGPA1_41054 [Streptomyces misionensis JCM 4497]
MHDPGLELPRLGIGDLRIADDDHQIAGVHEMRGRPVDPDDTRAALTLDDVGLQPGAIGDVDDVHQLAGQQIRRVEQLRVDGHRSHVVQVGLGDGGAVDLGLEQSTQHFGLLKDGSLPALCRSGASFTVHRHTFQSKTCQNIVRHDEQALHLRDLRKSSCRRAVLQEQVRKTGPVQC